MDQSNTKRFSNRVDDYVKYRPGYPKEIVRYLVKKYKLQTSCHIADIGSGTGLSALPFLEEGFKVTGVEPNGEMREKSVELLAGTPQFGAVDGSAENTGLAGNTIDLIVCGQAFHWFDRAKTKTEFSRILKPEGAAALIWNERLTKSDFEREYDELIVRHAIDYVTVDHRNIDLRKIETFFNPAPVTLEVFSNQQVFDFEGLTGRLLSSSYMPDLTHPGFAAMQADLKVLFDRYAENNTVTIHYETKVFSGRWH